MTSSASSSPRYALTARQQAEALAEVDALRTELLQRQRSRRARSDSPPHIADAWQDLSAQEQREVAQWVLSALEADPRRFGPPLRYACTREAT